MENNAAQFEKSAIQALRNQTPIRDIPGVRITGVRQKPEEPFDLSFKLESGKSRVRVLAEIRSASSPKLLEEIAPWIRRMKSLRPDVAFAVISPALSLQSQAYCVQNGINFLDLAGNIFINVPGKFTLQRLGMRSKERNESASSFRNINVFSGRSSRVLRVLLEKPKRWTFTEIAKELAAETERVARTCPNGSVDFAISLGSISKALASLEEQLWIRRQGNSILIPEPSRVLDAWAEKYKERYRWRMRSSFQTSNPFGAHLEGINQGLRPFMRGLYAFTGAAAAALDAPFIELDQVDVFLSNVNLDRGLRQLDTRPKSGPKLRFTFPYDAGVFMYSRLEASIPTVSNIQAYLDLYARGGRDLKQADYLLSNAIEPRWRTA
ncbi:MAG: hypothetical protein ABSG54_11135 [Terriglobia bacterium]|jgi:hypothetical protein